MTIDLSIRSLGLVFVTWFLIASCGNTMTPTISMEGWRTIEKTPFSIKLPPSFQEVAVQGIDTSVYKFHDSDIVITIEYGLYAKVTNTAVTQSDYREETVSTGWRSGRLISYSSSDENGKQNNTVALAFENIGISSNSFLASVQFERESDREKVLNILGTIELK